MDKTAVHHTPWPLDKKWPRAGLDGFAVHHTARFGQKFRYQECLRNQQPKWCADTRDTISVHHIVHLGRKTRASPQPALTPYSVTHLLRPDAATGTVWTKTPCFTPSLPDKNPDRLRLRSSRHRQEEHCNSDGSSMQHSRRAGRKGRASRPTLWTKTPCITSRAWTKLPYITTRISDKNPPACFCPARPSQPLGRASFRPNRASFRPPRASFRPDRATPPKVPCKSF